VRFALFSTGEKDHQTLVLRLSILLRNALATCGPFITPGKCWPKSRGRNFNLRYPRAYSSSYLRAKRSSLTIENVSIVSPLMVLKYASALCGSPPALKVINSAP
jgi:hypothetical protein